MRMILSATILAFHAAQSLATPVTQRSASASVSSVTCNGKKYVYEELAGFGKLPSDARDKFGDTIGGIGSSIAIDIKSTKKEARGNGSYTGVLYGLPDRGWNTQGTQNTQARIHKFGFTFNTVQATVASPVNTPNFKLNYLDTILLTGPNGAPLTGIDANSVAKYDGFPDLPQGSYTGNGFGQDGPGGSRVALDTEGLVLGTDGTYWISDEYGPYIYKFSPEGKMLRATRPPDAFIPQRNGTESFSSASAPIYDRNATVRPTDPSSGRANNQGFEALTRSSDGKYLYAMLQSALVQDGGTSGKKRRTTRLLKYAVGSNNVLTLEGEYAVQLPVLDSGKAATQSEMHYISPTQFLVLARDGGAGHGAAETESHYRNADVIDISAATNLKGATSDATDGQIASDKGKLNDNITAATYCPWLSYNDNSQLHRFGLHNGGAQDANLLNEKWESLALLPISAFERATKTEDCQKNQKGQDDDSNADTNHINDDQESKSICKYDGHLKAGNANDYFLITMSDNDFITQNGFINSGKMPYKDASGYSIDTQLLVFKVSLPTDATPLLG